MNEFGFDQEEPKELRRLVSVPAPTASLRPEVSVLDEVQVRLSVPLGGATLRVKDVLGLEPGALVRLDTAVAEEVEILLNGKVVAQGEIVSIDEHYGIRVSKTYHVP
jgi:flagellar motor switch protein FliN/FliY